MSGDMGQMQLSTRELQVQMENAKTTIKDLEQVSGSTLVMSLKPILDLTYCHF